VKSRQLQNLSDAQLAAEGIEIAAGAQVDPSVVIYPEVVVGEGTRVFPNAVLGRLSAGVSFVHQTLNYKPTIIRQHCVIGPHCVLYTDVRLDDAVTLCDGVSIREQSRLSERVFLGRYVTLNYNVHIGKCSRIMDLTHITGNSWLGKYVFIADGVSTANDNDIYMSRFGWAEPDHKGPNFSNFCVVGAGASALPAVNIGQGSMLAAGAVATRNVPDWEIWGGVPAKHMKYIPDEWKDKVLKYYG